MSLINDVLRELDRRGVDTPILTTVGRTAPPPPRRRSRVIWLLAVLLLAIVGAWLVQRAMAPAAPLTPTRPSEDIVAAAPVSSPRRGAVQDGSAALPPTALPAVAPVHEATQQEAAARAAPGPDPSPSRGSPPAMASTAPPVALATQPKQQAARPPPAMPPANVAASTRPSPLPSPSSSPGSSPTGDAAAAIAAGDPTRPVSAAAAEPPVLAEPAQRLSIQRRRDSSDLALPALAELLQQSSAALAAGRDEEARHALQRVLDHAPTQHQARLSLAALQAERGEVGDAIALLEAGMVLAPQQSALAERLGRLRLQQGEPARAAAILAQALPPLAEQPSHHALLALAWHQAGQPAPAARIYQSLLEHDARVAPWWLGLAMARDALGERAAARTAFTQALRADGLDEGVLRYVRQRIAEIEANSP